MILGQFSNQIPNRVFLKVPSDRKDWISFIKTLDKWWWHPNDLVWSIPRNAETAKRCKDFWGTELRIDRTHAINLSEKPARTEVQPKEPYLSAVVNGRITLHKHPQKSDWLLLNLPQSMLESHLGKVKNIHNRRWNANCLAWEVPYTQLTVRFIRQYLNEVTHWTFIPDDNLPERLDAVGPKPQVANEMFIPARYEAAVQALEQTLMLKRYSWRTIKSYKNCFRLFIRHYDEIKPSEISRKQIDAYVFGLIKSATSANRTKTRF
jgi:hypothetical protein